MSTVDGGDTTAGRSDGSRAGRARIHHRKAIILVVVGVLVAALAATTTAVLIGWSTQAASSCDNRVDNSREMIVDATVIAVDTSNQQATMRLDFAPTGSLTDSRSGNIAPPVDVMIQGLTATPSSVDSVSTFT